jgi:hypothetical protein
MSHAQILIVATERVLGGRAVQATKPWTRQQILHSQRFLGVPSLFMSAASSKIRLRSHKVTVPPRSHKGVPATGVITIVHISDTHDRDYDELLPPADILIHSGEYNDVLFCLKCGQHFEPYLFSQVISRMRVPWMNLRGLPRSSNDSLTSIRLLCVEIMNLGWIVGQLVL